MVNQIKLIGDVIEQKEADKDQLKATIDSMVGKVGNLVDLSVPVSQDEDKDNEVIHTWGTPRDPAGLLNHHDLLWRIGGYEPERGVGVAGHRAYFLRDVGVLLNQAFINYGIAFLRKKGYTCLQPPYFMKKSVMSGVAQLEQFDEELYKVSGDGEDKYLIATSEQPICGYHMGEWLEEKSLPLRSDICYLHPTLSLSDLTVSLTDTLVSLLAFVRRQGLMERTPGASFVFINSKRSNSS
jgi:seryl-tRNA synthetase